MVCDAGRVKGGAGLGVGFSIHIGTVTTMGEGGWWIRGSEGDTGRVKVGGAGLEMGFSILVGTITIIYIVGLVI